MNDYVDKGEFTVGKGFYFCRQLDGKFIDYNAIVSFDQWKKESTDQEIFRNNITGKTEAWKALVDESRKVIMQRFDDTSECPYSMTRYDLKPEIIEWLNENVGSDNYGVAPHKPEDNDVAGHFIVFFTKRRDATKFVKKMIDNFL